MTNQIVTVAVSQTVAPTPNNLQSTGAFISQGATITSPGTSTLLTQLSDLTPFLAGSKAVTSITQSAGLATVTATVAHGLTVGDTLPITIAGSTIAAYNGTFTATVTTTTAFTYAVPSGTASPATGTIVYTLEDVAELLAMATTFFAQGSSQSVYVLELGAGNATDGVTFLTAWITANPGVYYSYLVPRFWDSNASFLSMMASFESNTSKTYFFITTTLATYQNYTNLMKCALTRIEAPAYGVWAANALTAISYSSGIVTGTTTTNHGVLPGQYFKIAGVTPAGYNGTWLALTGTTGSTLVYAVAANPGAETVLGTLVASLYSSAGIPALEFSQAAAFWKTLSYAPSTTNKVTPLSFAFYVGVTPFPTKGNAAILSALKTAGVNVIGTGAEGGISNTLELWGTTMDGRPFNYWYAVDWAQINLDLDLSNAIINGSNNPVNPLYYNQPGINQLQKVAQGTLNRGVTFGMLLGPVFVAAVPFVAYTQDNPSDYPLGVYNGLSASVTPQRGFEQILFNLQVTDFVSA